MKGRTGPQFKYIMFALLNNLFSFVQITHIFQCFSVRWKSFKLVWISSLTCPFGWQCLHACWLLVDIKVCWIYPSTFFSYPVQGGAEAYPRGRVANLSQGQHAEYQSYLKGLHSMLVFNFKGLTNADDSCGPGMQKSVYIMHCLIYITLILYY